MWELERKTQLTTLIIACLQQLYVNALIWWDSKLCFMLSESTWKNDFDSSLPVFLHPVDWHLFSLREMFISFTLSFRSSASIRWTTPSSISASHPKLSSLFLTFFSNWSHISLNKNDFCLLLRSIDSSWIKLQ